MNLKIENNNLRFKITEEELKILLSVDSVHSKVNILGKNFIVSIIPQDSGNLIEAKLDQEGNETHLNLLVSLKDLQKLSDLGQSREGIETEMNDLRISLQVDVRSRRRRSIKS